MNWSIVIHGKSYIFLYLTTGRAPIFSLPKLTLHNFISYIIYNIFVLIRPGNNSPSDAKRCVTKRVAKYVHHHYLADSRLWKWRSMSPLVKHCTAFASEEWQTCHARDTVVHHSNDTDACFVHGITNVFCQYAICSREKVWYRNLMVIL